MTSRFKIKKSSSAAKASSSHHASGSARGRGDRLAEGVPLTKLIQRELADRPDIVMVSSPRSVFAERFRRLKTTLRHMDPGAPQVVVITSAVPSEGKSTVSINLATAFADEVPDQVLLIDADMRRPSIGSFLSPAPHLGLSEVLLGKVTVEHAILTLKRSPLHILPAGEPNEDPLRLLSSARARDLIEKLRKNYKWIIIDTPPVVPFTDADAAGALADGFLLVIRANSTPAVVFKQATENITSNRILGVVLNDTPKSITDRSRYYNKYYDDYFAKDRKK